MTGVLYPEPFGADLVPHQTRDLGVTVLGQTGYGKTTLLEQLILQDVARGTSVIVIDAHGDLTQRVLTLADTEDEHLLLLEAWEDAPFRLNLFECPDRTSAIAVDRTVSGIVQVFKRLFGSPREFYPRLERDLGNAARTVIANNGTLLDVPRLFWDPEFRATALERVTNPRVHEFWRLWERIGRADRQLEQLEATINRLDQFLASEFVSQLVGSTENTIPFDEVLDGDGRVLLLSLPVGEIGEGLTNLLGSLFLAVLTERIFARVRLAPGSRPRVHLYLDEYGRYATPTTAQLLTEGRKFGVGTTIAHQTRAQIPDEENRAAELQVGTLICFQLIGEDAQELSGEFHVEPDPQWEERVEEIEGTEPVLAISQCPVEHLLENTHENPNVRAIVQRQLLPLQTSESSAWKYDDLRPLKNQGSLVLINRLLVDVMEQRVPTTPAGMVDRLAEVTFTLCLSWHLGIITSAGLGESWRGNLNVSLYERDSLRECVRDFVAECLEQTPKPSEILTPSERALMDVLADIYKDQLERNVLYQTDPNERSRHCSRIPEYVSDERDRAARAVAALPDRIADLFRLCVHLAERPIMVPSGQERPRIRVRYITHPQRSYQDVQNELAVQLANLPRFTVYASILGEQHLLRVSPPIETKTDEERIERIRWVSKAKFGRRPPEPPPAPPSAPRGTPPPPAGPGISRLRPGEE